MAKEKVLNYEGLELYHGKSVALMDEKDAAVLLQAKEYAEGLGENYDAAGTAQTKVNELANGQVKTNTEAISALNETVTKLDGDVNVEGSVKAQINSAKTELENKITNSQYNDTQVKADIKANTDAITAINDTETGILKAAQTYADGKVKDVSDAINATIGTVTEGKTVVQMISDAQTAATYNDSEIRELIADNAEAIEAHKDEIDGVVTTLVGDDAGKSVRTIANEELVAQLIGENAKESLDTLEEIAAWIQSHPDDASAMNKAIEDLGKLVGTLPEGVTATTVVGYVQELVNAEKSRAEGVESGLNTRLETVETAIGEGGSVTVAIADAKKAGTDASAAVTALADGQVATNTTAIAKNAEDIAKLQSTLGEGVEPISADEINALFA